MIQSIDHCVICGGRSFSSKEILWDALVQEWSLSDDERHYINRQQGTHCDQCGCNLRSIALAKAIMAVSDFNGLFKSFVWTPRVWMKRLLEVNRIGGISAYLGKLPRRTLAEYPLIDMQSLPFENASFDLVLHSETLEHVPNPLGGLRECLRVLRPGGWCCFTIPIITGRLSRSRNGLSPSFHGQSDTNENDMLVQTEYGCDFWEQVLEAGFDECRIVSVEFPSAQAIAARKPLTWS
jgi:SAM-dependent methyltransferase